MWLKPIGSGGGEDPNLAKCYGYPSLDDRISEIIHPHQ